MSSAAAVEQRQLIELPVTAARKLERRKHCTAQVLNKYTCSIMAKFHYYDIVCDLVLRQEKVKDQV